MKFPFTLLCLIATASSVLAQIDARLFQFPDVSDTHIAFSYGGDIWLVEKEGGTAIKLTSPKGTEEFPKFSPDGKTLAFSGNYDGNTDVYSIPTQGGVPTRITHHGMRDRIIDWYPDGRYMLYASSMNSGKQRFSQFYKVSATGGLPEKLPIAYGEFASLSPDGKKVAYTDRSRVFRTWKRYRGGAAADVWWFDLETLQSQNITQNTANDELPMWGNNKIYYLSDKGANERYNLWAYDLSEKEHKQITQFADADVHFPSIGPKEIVFEAKGQLYLLDLATEAYKEVPIQVVTDLVEVKPKKEKVREYMQNANISPDGMRVVVEARGELFSLPAEKGIVKNLTNTSGFAERFPAWSPNGRYIAYWSDKSGEYELTLRDITEGGKEKKLTSLGPGFRYSLYWSPNSEKLAFVDQTMTIYIYHMADGTTVKVDQEIDLFEGGLRGWGASWSSDSKWLAYDKTLGNQNSAIFLFDSDSKKLTQATSGFYSDIQPTFDPDGKYLYLVTNRSFSPVYSDFDNTWSYPNATQLAMITLRKDIPSPMAAENDTVAIKMEEKKEEGEGDEKKEDEGEDEDEESEGVKIDFDGFERRLIVLPPDAGNLGGLSAVSGKVLFMRYPNSGSEGGESVLKYFDLEEEEEKSIMSGVRGYEVSADNKKIMIRKGSNIGIVDVGADQKLDETIALNEMEMLRNPREEWKQIYLDAWRFQRDYFYDREMHGVDWNTVKDQYGKLIDDATSREDVNYLIGEMIGELNASHTYRGGGDLESPERKAVGYLGIDWEKKGAYYTVKKIIRGAEWDNEVRSPLDEPGISVKEGDAILAVNGMELNQFSDPWAAFEGLAGKTVELTVSSTPSWEDSRTILVKTMRGETRLRNLAWIEENRKKVDEASGGKIGYIYVPSTGIGGQNELVRMFYGQWNKEGLIVDERFNNGGQIPDRFIELLNRKPLAYWAVRDGQNWQWPPVANFGSMAMLINGWAGSGGDAFPDYFRKAGLGPLIGGRTWGGLIGISGSPSLIDGGGVSVPTFRMYNPDGTWFKEGHGVAPDIDVPEDPTALAQGKDPQLERAVEEVLKSIEAKGPIHPEEPAREDRVPLGPK
ncbi:MAG: PDZ domain-containing protein [Bacteroidota bacterium]